MRRAVVTVATDSYLPFQERLIARVHDVDPGCTVMSWQSMPDGCPAHAERPYAFKSYALAEAAQVADLLLWCDAPIVPVRDMAPLWERIERDGYWIARNGWNNYEWTADSAYNILFPGMPLDQARKINKQIPHVVASAFGISVQHPFGEALLREYCRLCDTTAISGPWRNTPETPCGPSEVLGHRHDQTILSFIAWKLSLSLTDCPEIFSYAPGTDASILVSDGGMTLSHVLAER
jgi:hypothetical protein